METQGHTTPGGMPLTLMLSFVCLPAPWPDFYCFFNCTLENIWGKKHRESISGGIHLPGGMLFFCGIDCFSRFIAIRTEAWPADLCDMVEMRSLGSRYQCSMLSYCRVYRRSMTDAWWKSRALSITCACIQPAYQMLTTLSHTHKKNYFYEYISVI